MLANASIDKIPLTFDERIKVIEGAIDRHHAYLERYLQSLTRNHADAEDLLSRLWVHALHKFKDDQLGNLPLLRRKAYQLFVDHYRQKARSREDLREHLPDHPVQHVGKEAYSTEEEEVLRLRFWAEFPVDLPNEQREALWLSARYGFTIQEIADRLSVPSSTIGDWLIRSRQALADHLNNS